MKTRLVRATFVLASRKISSRSLRAAWWLLLALVVASSSAWGQNGQTGSTNVIPVQIVYLARGGCQPAQLQRKAGEFLYWL
jgi:hypothetical protein